MSFVPTSRKKFCNETFFKIKELILNSKKITIITGAGVSTESGIPDYRSPGVGLYAKSRF